MLSSRAGAGLAAVIVLGACNALTGASELRLDNRTKAPAPEEPEEEDPPPRNRGRDDAGSSDLDGGFEASTDPATFADSFDRADSTDVGNGWSEKTDLWSLVNNGVQQVALGDFSNAVNRRPATESALDVELAVDFTYAADPEVLADPTLYARIQPQSDQMDQLHCYSGWLYRDRIGIDRESGPSSSAITISSSAINPPLTVGETFRIVFRVTGTNPVQLAASVTRLDGTLLGTVGSSDVDPARIEAAGQVGFGSVDANGGRWDNFKMTNLAR